MHQVDPLGLVMTRWVTGSRVDQAQWLEWYECVIAQARARIYYF